MTNVEALCLSMGYPNSRNERLIEVGSGPAPEPVPDEVLGAGGILLLW